MRLLDKELLECNNTVIGRLQKGMLMMHYIAHAAIRLRDEMPDITKNEWKIINRKNEIEYRWRLCDDLTYEVICGLYNNKEDALKKAKQMYVSLLYWILKEGFIIEEAGCELYFPRHYIEEIDGSREEYLSHESYFFWNKENQGGRQGPGVFEVSDSLDEFSDYNLNEIKWTITLGNVNLDFHGIDDYIFLYSQDAQEYLKSMIFAEKATNMGLKMTIYCGLLEHLSSDGYKEPAFVEEIDKLIRVVNDSQISQENKIMLINYLENGKKVSSNQKCITLCEKYAQQSYGGYSVKKVFKDAYKLRSKYSHGEIDDSFKLRPAYYIKYVVLDIIENIMQEREKLKNQVN